MRAWVYNSVHVEVKVVHLVACQKKKKQRKKKRAVAENLEEGEALTSPFGFGFVVSTGTVTPSISSGSSSITGEMILGYFSESHLNNAGTPILVRKRDALDVE